MTPCILEDIQEEDLNIFNNIKHIIEKLPDITFEDGDDFSSHMITRALTGFFPVIVQDGHFGNGGWQHSWLTTESGLVIIDPYPWVMVGGPIMVYVGSLSPWTKLYKECKKSWLGSDDFRTKVGIVRVKMAETIFDIVDKLFTLPNSVVR